MSGDRSGDGSVVPSSPFAGLRDWLFASRLRFQLFVILIVAVGTIGVAVGTLVFLGLIPGDEPTDAGAGPTATPAPTPTPTPTATPTATATPTPRDVVGDYRAATVVGTTTGGYLSLQFPDGEVRQLPLAGIHVPGAGGASPAAYDGVVEGPAGRACLGEYGTRAAVQLESELSGERVGVRVVTDRTVSGDTGVYVRSRGQVVNHELVRQGYARATTDEYYDAMVDAREGEQGLWECGTVEPMVRGNDVVATVEIRPDHAAEEGGLRIVEVRPNPPDGAPVAAETVTLRNTGSTTVDLSGWRLGNLNGNGGSLARAGTAEDRRVQPGEELIVHTGSGLPRDGHLYLGKSSGLWGDAGGTVRLSGPSNRRTVTVRYGNAALSGTDTRRLTTPGPTVGR